MRQSKNFVKISIYIYIYVYCYVCVLSEHISEQMADLPQNSERAPEDMTEQMSEHTDTL